MIVAESQRSEPAEEIENRAPVLVVIIHAFRAFDLHLMKAEQLHEMKLARIEVGSEQLGHPWQVERLRFAYSEQFRLWRCIGSGHFCLCAVSEARTSEESAPIFLRYSP